MANPNRFFLGTSTPRETHDLLRALVAGTLLSPASTTYLLGLLRSPVAFTDGIRRTMSSTSGPGSPPRPAGSPTPGTRPA